MKCGLVLAGLLLAGGCTEPPSEPAAAMNEHDRWVAKMEADYRAWDETEPCVRSERDRLTGTLISRSIRPRHCMEFGPAEVMHGVWFTSYEEAGFIPNVDSVPLRRVIGGNSENPEFDIYLDIEGDTAMQRMGAAAGNVEGTRAYAITFVGRRGQPGRRLDGGPGTPVIVVDALLTGRLVGRVMTRIEMRGCEGECAQWR